MGLLEDAIREHLELKRRRGADPGEVARAAREALEPLPETAPAPNGGLDAELEPVDQSFEQAPSTADGVQMDSTAYEPGPEELSSVGQDTAELDMLTVLGEGHEQAALPGPWDPVAAARPTAGPPAGEPLEDEALEWEMPARATGEQHAGDLGDLDGEGRRRISDGHPGPGEEHVLEDGHTHAEISGQERLTFE